MLDTIMGILCMMFGVAALSFEFNKLRQCSSRAEATVVEVKRQESRGLKIYSPVFEFHVDGKTIRGNGGVPGSQFRRRFQVGETLQVLYEEGNPEHFRVRGNYTMFAIGVFFLLSGIYMYTRKG